ncbi:ATP-binding cassette domain-containing protein [Gryllotalpicola reticulitermitis]|uniref:ATP-binding cassette domain-containing protein n=1 Tax=Gryllotalpicola reticulitermitis TaxID=1184153 RepID=A0ABV8QAV5_9MICO
MPALRLEHLGKIYSGASATTVLTGIELEIAQGDFVAIEGPSGGGKSTLLNIIGLLDEPTSGSYRIDDVDTGRSTSRRLAEARSDTFAFIFQAFHLLDRRPVVDSVELALLYRGLRPADRRRRALEALQTVNIAHLARQKAGTLSGGERQRVAIARALAAETPVVVADEPTGNLDSQNGKAVTDALSVVNARGSTVVLVTHSPETAEIASRRVRLRDGRVLSDIRARPSSSEHAAPAPPGKPSRLRARDLAFDALASIRSRAGRSLGLIAAVALGVGLAVSTAGITSSAGAQVAGTFNAHTNRDVTVAWEAGALTASRDTTDAAILAGLRAVAGVRAASLLRAHDSAELQVNPNRAKYSVTVYGASGDYESASRSTVQWAPGHAHRLHPHEALIGATLAQQIKLGPLVGSPLVSLGGIPTTIAGVITATPRVADALGAVVLPQDDATKLAAAGHARALVLTESGAAQQVARQAPVVIDPFAPEALDVSAPRDPTSLRAEIQREVRLTLIVFTTVAMLASIVGLANTSILAVLERRQEFGLRRAVGALGRHIFTLVLTETAMLGLIGGCGGLVAGLGSVLGVTMLNHWAPVFDLRVVPVALAGGIVVGAIGGLAASIRATRIRPSDALRA